MFWWRNKKIKFSYALLTKVLTDDMLYLFKCCFTFSYVFHIDVGGSNNAALCKWNLGQIFMIYYVVSWGTNCFPPTCCFCNAWWLATMAPVPVGLWYLKFKKVLKDLGINQIDFHIH